jgi:putative peptide zinc metalloprotease protein
VANRSTARLTFRGGGITVLCAGTELAVGELISDPLTPIQPTAALTLSAGRLLVDTQTRSDAFQPLRLTVAGAGPQVANDGAARYAVNTGGTAVAQGRVLRGGTPIPVDPDADITCGDGTALPRPTTTTTPPPSPSDSPSPSPSESASASPGPSVASPTPTRSRTPTPTPTPTPIRGGPTVTGGGATFNPVSQRLGEGPCQGESDRTIVVMRATDPDDALPTLSLTMTYVVEENTKIAGTVKMTYDDGFNQSFTAPLPVINYTDVPSSGGRFTVQVRASDPAGNVSAPFGLTVTIAECPA